MHFAWRNSSYSLPHRTFPIYHTSIEECLENLSTVHTFIAGAVSRAGAGLLLVKIMQNVCSSDRIISQKGKNFANRLRRYDRCINGFILRE